MANPQEDRQVFSLAYIFEVTRKYSLYIMGVIGVSVLMAIVLTLPFIYEPEFLSSNIMYPTSSERFDLANIFAEEPDLYVYGAGKEVEKLENIAGSERVKFAVIDSLDLWEVYGIEPESDDAKYQVLRAFDNAITTVRVSGHGLRIEAYDVEPQRAADIVNYMVYLIDQVNQEMVGRNTQQALEAYEAGARSLEACMVYMSDSLATIRRTYNVLRPITQTEPLTEQVMIAEGELAEAEAGRGSVAAARAKVRALTEKAGGAAINLESFREGLDKVQNLENVLIELSTDLANTHEKVAYLRGLHQVSFSTIMVADRAYPADRKARPVRWIILLATLILASVVSIFGAVLVEGLTDTLPEPEPEAKAASK
jgi:hypothetical protein